MTKQQKKNKELLKQIMQAFDEMELHGAFEDDHPIVLMAQDIDNKNKAIKALEEAVKVESVDEGCFNSEYTHGFTNGVIHAKAIIDGVEPNYKHLVGEYLCDQEYIEPTFH